MTAIVHQDHFGTSAFLTDPLRATALVMNGNHPCVEWSFRIKELQNWLTTLEEVMSAEHNQHHASDLRGIYCSLKAAMDKHEEQHEAIVTDAPTADDLQAYLASYAAAVMQNGV